VAINVNRITLVGRLGKDPERKGQEGKIVSFSLATSRSWKTRDGNRDEKTEWHRVVCFNEQAGNFAATYLKKGDLVYVEGAMEYREYERDGQRVPVAEVVLRPYDGVIQAQSQGGGREDSGGSSTRRSTPPRDEVYTSGKPGTDRHRRYEPGADIDDDIPF
jgi:single-strand DNA-binding protein